MDILTNIIINIANNIAYNIDSSLLLNGTIVSLGF